MLKKTLFTLATLVLLILLCEGAVRLTGVDKAYFGDPFGGRVWWTDHIIPDPFLKWRGRPGGKLSGTEERLNTRGYRGPEFAKRKAPGTVRIAVLGDSCSFGQITIGTNDYEFLRNYSQILQNLLDETFGRNRFGVFNYAHLGYTTFHGRRLLAREALSDDPDIVIIRYGWNDHLATNIGRSFSDPQNPFLAGLKYSLYRSRLIAMLLFRGPPQFARERIWESTPHPTVWVTEENYARNLSRMIAQTRGHGAEPLLIDAPTGALTPEIRAMKGFLKISGFDTFESWLKAHARYQEITARVAQQEGVPFVRTLASRPGNGPSPFFNRFDFSHPNAAGHESIARVLFREISSLAGRKAGAE